MNYKRNNTINAVKLRLSLLLIAAQYLIAFTHCENVQMNSSDCRKMEVYYQCKVKNLQISESNDSLVDFNIKAPNGTSPNDIRIESSNISFIPKKIFEEFHDLKEFVATNCSIKFIYHDTFMSAFKLHYLVLSHNNISFLPNYSFRNLSDLQTLKLDNNEIEVLTTNVFRGLDTLRTLKLSFNRITYLPLYVFYELESLEILHLDNNNIKIISLEQFVTNLQLTQIDLRNNQLTTIDNGTLDSLTNLREMNLENNVCVNTSVMHMQNVSKILECCMTSYEEVMGCLASKRDALESGSGLSYVPLFLILFVSIFANIMLFVYCFKNKQLLERVRRSDTFELINNFMSESSYQVL